MNPKIIKGFEKEYKVKVQQTYFANMQGMLAKIRAGVKYDVTFPEADYADQLVQAKYLLPLDESKIPNLQYVAKPFQNPWYDAGAKYSVPYAIWTTGIFWNKKALGPMTGSWNDLWNTTAKTKGKLWLLDDMKEVIGMSLLRDGKPISSTKSGDVKTAASNVLKLKSSVRGFTSVADQVKNGQSVMSHLWSGTSFQALLALKSPSDWQYETAKEGIPVGSDTIVIPKNAPHPNTAMLFLNWMLAPQNSAANPPVHRVPDDDERRHQRLRQAGQEVPLAEDHRARGGEGPALHPVVRLCALALQRAVGQDQGLSRIRAAVGEVGW